MTIKSTTPICSFCSKDQKQVTSLVAGPNDLYICDECIEICNDTIHSSKKHLPSTVEPKFSVSEEKFYCATLQFYNLSQTTDMLKWLDKNVKNAWVNTYEETKYNSKTYKIIFENESDLIAFKIRWI